MPGPKSSGQSSLKIGKSFKTKAKRSHNALAIAEQQTPIRSKVRKNRLGESEPESPKRRRRLDEDPNLRNDNVNVKRQRSEKNDRYGNEIEVGSDSSGNEWTVGQVGDDDDDSDIDSDEAMAESDEEGATIRGSVVHSSRVKDSQKGTNLNPDDDKEREFSLMEDEDEGGAPHDETDSLGDEAVDLAAVLDESDDGEGLPGVLLEGSDEEESKNGGGLDAHSKSVSENESIISYSEDEDEEGDPAKLASLRALVSEMHEQDQASRPSNGSTDTHESITPSEFGLNSKRKLTVADLVPSVSDPQLRKSLKLLADNDTKSTGKRSGIPKKLDVPLPKRQQDRLDRAAAYEQSKETLNRWIDTVKHNRRADHLSFPLKDPNAATAQGSTRLLPTSRMQPLTDLESTIYNIMEESGLVGPGKRSEEEQLQAFEELKTNTMPLEEVKARRAELRMARELLFREEVRAKRIKKIKSKTYRKTHRKERERSLRQEKDARLAAGVEDSESEKERNDRRRATERMGARHRESKWAKGVKESGRAKWDDDARDGVTEMARRGEELKRRIEGKALSEEDDSAASSEPEEQGSIDDFANEEERSNMKSRQSLRKLNGHVNELESNARGSGLASMDFMKNAENARKARNDAALKELRRDLEGGQSSSGDDVDGPGRRIFGPTKSRAVGSTTILPESKNEFEEKQDSDLEDGDGHNKSIDEEVEISTGILNREVKAGRASESIIDDRQKTAFETSQETLVKANENPWLTPSAKGSKSKKKRMEENDKGPLILNTLPIEAATPSSAKTPLRSAFKGSREAEQTRQTNRDSAKRSSPEASDQDEDDVNNGNLPFVLRNQDLVRKAFAGDEVVADFEAEKRAIIEDEEEKVIDNTLPGWGSWTGIGIGKKQQKRNKGKVLTKQPGIAKEKRQDAKLDRVIINEKRVKKNAKYLASSLPHPFESRQQYQRSLRMPVGPEFATKLAYQDATKPRILMKQGIITPMTKSII